jgi:1-aminocyclopropane-1-carboxylate deaminase/D-cysteine desulfhydrase-like pyridoxal-dependent ACC family enzyme
MKGSFMEINLESLEHDFSPVVQISELSAWNGTRFVVRDDLLTGGTKQRACAPYLRELASAGYKNFVYASPFSGFAQVALAYTAQKLGYSCTIVCEKDQRYPKMERLHPFSMLAHSFGAHILMVDHLEEADEVAFRFSRDTPDAIKLPLGFDSPIFRDHLKRELTLQWDYLERKIMRPIKTLWLPVGSGTLAKTFHEIIPDTVQMKCVNVRVLTDSDYRIQMVNQLDRVELMKAPMLFHEEAVDLPAIPSNIFYDAKIWDFLKLDGEDGDVWWNVAR